MAGAFSQFSQTVWSSKLAFVKENKLYRSLAGKKTPNGLELKGSWEEFCNLLGVSDEKANQDIANLREFGEEALESMSRMGIGYRELRQFRKLPEDQKIALIEVAKEGDKDSLLELAEELIAKHSKEKEEITQRLVNTETDLENSRQRVATLKDARDKLEEQLSEKKFNPITDSQLAERNRLEATSISSKIVRELMGSLRGAFTELEKDSSDRGVDHSRFMIGLICEIRSELDDICQRYHISSLDVVTTKPAWLTEPEDTEA